MSDEVATESVEDTFAGFDRWPMSRRIAALVGANERAVRAVTAAAPELARAAETVAERLAAGGRLVYAGAGTSGRLALQDAAELPPTFDFERTVVLIAGGDGAGTAAREDAEDDAEAAVRAVDAAGVGPDDVLVALAASGRTPFTVAAVRRARERGAETVAIANNPGSPLLLEAGIAVLLDTGPEVVAGSTRLVAGTAQKIALNALSTAPMVELGRIHGNLMVAMRPKNEKLRERAVGLVARAASAPAGVARGALLDSDWDIRTAIVRVLTGASPEDATQALADAGGRIRGALVALGHDEAS